MTYYYDLMTLMAQAQGGGGGSSVPGRSGGGMVQILFIVMLFAVFYFLLIRPQQKRAKDHREMLSNLRRGDEIITNGGVLGRITGLTDRYITLEVAEKIRLRVMRSHILGKQADVKTQDEPVPSSSSSSSS